MSTLQSRVEALEARGSGGLELVMISWLPTDGKRETATYKGVTYTQDVGETCEQFRERLAQTLKKGSTRFLWVSELDWAL